MLAARFVVLSAAAVVALSAVSPATAAPGDPSHPVTRDREATGRPLPVPPAATTATATRQAARHALDAAARRAPARVATVGLVVRLEPGARVDTVRSTMRRSLGLSPRSGLAKLGYLTVTVPASDVAARRSALAATPGVASVSVARPRARFADPTDPLYSSEQSVMYSAVHGPAAWDVSTGAGATIAVLDGGFDVTHEDLAGNIAAAWDVVANTGDVSDAPGAEAPGHGTGTASVAAAVTNNGHGIAGAAGDAKLLLLQVADAAGGLDSANSALGIVYAVDHGADVISMSYGGTANDPIEQAAVAYAVAHGVVVVAAAGNGGTTVPNYPAAYSGVVAVGSTTNDGLAASTFSEHGSWVDVAAPGEAVPVAVPPAYDNTDGSVDGYTVVDGTSFSAPMVAGEAALLLALHPTTPPGSIASILASTTTAPTLGFAHGLVQFDAAVAAVPADTVLTAPADGASVSGSIVVSATSGSPSVRFDIVGTPVKVTVPVVSGVATTILPSYGLSGPATVSARGCDATTCGRSGATAGVTISNDAPVLTLPVDGSTVGVSFTAAATAGGGAVRFYVDGSTSVGLDTSAPYSLVVDTTSVPDGAHLVTAASCTIDGTVCDTAHPSAAAGITVKRLRPTVKVGPSPFSPNADGRRDTTTVTFSLEQPQTVWLRIFGPTGALVRGPISFGLRAAGTYTSVWNGRSNANALVANGTYRAEITSTRVLNAGLPSQTTLAGLASALVRVDRTPPSLTSVVPASKTFYPVQDTYLDTDLLGATVNEPLSVLTVTVRNSAGTKVRTLSVTAAKPAGRVAIAWDGRTSSRILVPAGTYRYQVLAQDSAGNQRLSAVGYVVVSLKKLVKKSATAAVAPYTSAKYSDIGDCSAVYYYVRSGWPNSLGYYSLGNPDPCDIYAEGTDLAAVEHAFTLPAAVRYGTVRVTASGGSATSYPDSAGLIYYDKAGNPTSAQATLAPSDGVYSGPTVTASSYLAGGRTLWWLTGTVNGNWYDVVEFHVIWTYYVLV